MPTLIEKLKTGIWLALCPLQRKPKNKGLTLDLFNDLLDRQMSGLRLGIKDKSMTVRMRHQQEGRLLQCRYLKQEVNGWYR